MYSTSSFSRHFTSRSDALILRLFFIVFADKRFRVTKGGVRYYPLKYAKIDKITANAVTQNPIGLNNKMCSQNSVFVIPQFKLFDIFMIFFKFGYFLNKIICGI
jgi:hypothetical protein